MLKEGVSLSSQFDSITEDEDVVFCLDYKFYQSYIIYSTNEGTCCIHGAGQRGYLKLENKFVSFLGSTHVMRLIDSFQANGWDAYLHMSRRISTDVYLCLNASERVHVEERCNRVNLPCAL